MAREHHIVGFGSIDAVWKHRLHCSTPSAEECAEIDAQIAAALGHSPEVNESAVRFYRALEALVVEQEQILVIRKYLNPQISNDIQHRVCDAIQELEQSHNPLGAIDEHLAELPDAEYPTAKEIATHSGLRPANVASQVQSDASSVATHINRSVAELRTVAEELNVIHRAQAIAAQHPEYLSPGFESTAVLDAFASAASEFGKTVFANWPGTSIEVGGVPQTAEECDCNGEVFGYSYGAIAKALKLPRDLVDIRQAELQLAGLLINNLARKCQSQLPPITDTDRHAANATLVGAFVREHAPKLETGIYFGAGAAA